MLAIEVEYLLGRAVATDTSSRGAPEWPPHPTRLFSAFVDALSDVSEGDAHGRAEASLRWVEQQPPPEIAVSLDDEVSTRTVVRHFVPINDETVDPKKIRSSALVEQRTRQDRFFPAVVPADPRVVFAWPKSEPSDEQLAALNDLAMRVPYLGHSSSVVRVRCGREAPARTIAPRLAGDYLLRVPGPGRLDRLNAVHSMRVSDTYVQPPKGKEIPYERLDARAVASGPHGAMHVLALSGSRFGLAETAWLTARFRAALLSKLPDGRKTPESLSGHDESGGRSRRPHLAIVPLANVAERGDRHADGGIKGLALLVPRDVDENAVRLLESAVPRVQRLLLGARGEIELHPRGDLFSLGTHRYTRSSATWASVTPLALGRHAKPGKGLTEEDVVARHLQDLGLPQPSSIRLGDVSSFWGSPPARGYQRGKVTALAGRQLRHAEITFAEPVAGPLVVGAGGHMGFGLLMARSST